MASDPRQIITAICPELAASPSLDVFLGMAVDLTDRGFWGKMYPYAVAYRAAHLFTLTGSAANRAASAVRELGGGAPVASMSEGGLSVSFAQSAGATDAASLGSTKHGRMLLGLLKSRPTMGVNNAGGF
jgi:hypothetical protein